MNAAGRKRIDALIADLEKLAVDRIYIDEMLVMATEKLERYKEDIADGAAAKIRDRLDPVFFNTHGILRSWEQIAAITRGRVAGIADAEILALFEEDE